VGVGEAPKRLPRCLGKKMAFVAAISAASKRNQGVNGANCYTEDGVGDPRVALYTSMVRGLGGDELAKSVGKVLEFGARGGTRPLARFDTGNSSDEEAAAAAVAAAISCTPEECARDLWLLAFQARDVRGGKGERDLFATAFNAVMRKRGAAGVAEGRALLPLVPEYGSWLDVVKLFADPNCPVHSDALALIVKQFRADRSALKAQKAGQKGAASNISLLAKWLPREGSETCGKHTPSIIAEALYPTIPSLAARMRLYRKQCSELNAAIKTVEVAMCGGVWATIEPGHVPGRAMKLYRKAFLNLDKRDKQRSTKEDRVACANAFKAHLTKVIQGKATVKGGDTVFPHEIVRAISRGRVEGDEETLLTAQWQAIRDKVEAAGAMGSCVPMCDFSGSMSGIPLEVSMALGILLSEVNAPAFRGGMLTFDSVPQWLSFPAGTSLQQKVRLAMRVGHGLNTNFEAALQMVLDRMVEHAVPVGEEPENIVVFTDMGFDDACRGMQAGAGRWETILETFQRRFKAAGGWKVPKIVIWNLRAAYRDYHAKADQPGVLMLSGWSPSAMKLLTEGIQAQTPYEGMRAVLDDKRYDAVRVALAAAVTAT
jgi:hypothetical protein